MSESIVYIKDIQMSGETIWDNIVYFDEVSNMSKINNINKIVLHFTYDLSKESSRFSPIDSLRPSIGLDCVSAACSADETATPRRPPSIRFIPRNGVGHVWKLVAEENDIRRAGVAFLLDSRTHVRMYNIKLEISATKRPGSKVLPGVVITVNSWANLAIGISEDGYWAFDPCPSMGEQVTFQNAIQLPLKGKRWQIVLSEFAGSANGRSARTAELITGLGYARRGYLSQEYAQAQGLKILGKARDTLRSTMSDLGRELRKLVRTTDATTLFQSTGDNYESPLTVAWLLKDERGITHFGRRSR